MSTKSDHLLASPCTPGDMKVCTVQKLVPGDCQWSVCRVEFIAQKHQLLTDRELDDIFNVMVSHKIKISSQHSPGTKNIWPIRIRMLPGVYPWSTKVFMLRFVTDTYIRNLHVQR